jgi:chromate reductase, NAD(P)H dehydrogenase (quinone)
MKILAISGSLRAASLNTMLLNVIARRAPDDIEINIFQGLDELPLFNPDIGHLEQPAVAFLKNEIIAADAVIIASPEYAHGITGVLKNALDWMVGNESFVFKPVAILNSSPRATHAHESLTEILRTMSATLVMSASITIPILGSHASKSEMIESAQVRTAIDAVLRELQKNHLELNSTE